MSKYRAGQLVEITWPNGTCIKGVLNRSLFVDCPPSGYAFYVQDGTYTRDGRTVTILSDPRPDEPPPGSVVEAKAYFVGYNLDNPSQSTTFGPRKWMRGPHGGWDECATYGSPQWEGADWDDLIDPVILCNGWSPKCTCKDHRSLHEVSCPMYSEC